MNDPFGSVSWSDGVGDDLPDRIWTHGDFMPVQEFPVAELTAGFTSGSFIKAAVRRRIRLWCVTAFIGLLIGFGLYVKFPPAYKATATLLLTNPPNVDSATAMETEATLAQSLPVAQRVVQQLGLQQTPASLMAASTVSIATDQVLTVSVSAPSADAALARTNALAAAFLQFRASYLGIQQQNLTTELNQQQNEAQQHLDSITAKVNAVSAEPSAPDQQASLKKLLAEQADASNTLGEVKAYVVSALATEKTTTDGLIQDSKVLDPATLAKHSRVEGMGLYLVGGLVGGLALGMGFVIVAALTSDRLRRRDDVAEAFGAPVGLSVGKLRKPRVPSPVTRRKAQRELDMKRVVAHLRNTLPGSSRGPATLAVIAADDGPVAARAVASLAVSFAGEGRKVIVADLSAKADLRRLLGIKDRGTHPVSQGGTNFLVTVPEPDDVAPVGPLPGSTGLAVPGRIDPALATASNSADVLLTLVTLDPFVGSEYLATWATDSVVMVTVGKASEERIRSIRAMIRLAEIRLDSVVLVETDKSDQSVGVRGTRDKATSIGPV